MVDLQENNHNGYIYVIWVREFKTAGEPVYKIGRTSDVSRRVSQYPKGSQLLFCVTTPNMCKTETELLTMLGDHFVKRQDIGNEYFEGDITRLLTLVWEKMQNDGELATSSVLTRNASTAGGGGPSKRDPMQSISEYVQRHRAELSNKTEKGMELFERYLKTDEAVQLSFEKFTNTLKELYGVRVEPLRFPDGVHLGIVFPDIAGGCAPRRVTSSIEEITKGIPSWFNENFEPVSRTRTLPLRTVFKMFEDRWGKDVISKRQFGIALSSMGVQTVISNGKRVYRGWGKKGLMRVN